MPKRKRRSSTVYIGIDPGQSGGIASISEEEVDTLVKMPPTEQDVLHSIRAIMYEGFKPLGCPVCAMVERIDPRPTRWFDNHTRKWSSSILRSTCLIYADYMRLRAFLLSEEIPFEDVGPNVWQRAMGISPRKKTESKTQYKNRLKARAQQLFPKEKITLATCDALLIAEYCRRKYEGIL